MIKKTDIDYLFDDLWPEMNYNVPNKQNCLDNFDTIALCFKKWGKSFDELLDDLDKIDGIGLTIASGLIWSVYPYEAVPFDKHTMTNALDKRILLSNKISSGRYSTACTKIIGYCKKMSVSDSYNVEDFVIDSRDDVAHYPSENLISPT